MWASTDVRVKPVTASLQSREPEEGCGKRSVAFQLNGCGRSRLKHVVPTISRSEAEHLRTQTRRAKRIVGLENIWAARLETAFHLIVKQSDHWPDVEVFYKMSGRHSIPKKDGEPRNYMRKLNSWQDPMNEMASYGKMGVQYPKL